MDVWSTRRRQGYLALTGHWLVLEDDGRLVLKVALLGFHRLRGSHTGNRLARIVYMLLERAGILDKASSNCIIMICFLIHVNAQAGLFTMDNAKNNDTFIRAFAALMQKNNIPWFENPDHARLMCFPHVINLASEEAIKHFTKLDYSDDPLDLLDDEDDIDLDLTSLDRDDGYRPPPADVVQRARLLVKKVRASSLKDDLFALAVEAGNKAKRFTDIYNDVVELPSHQLLLDVKTRWDSLYYMLSRLLDMRPVSSSSIACPPLTDIYSLLGCRLLRPTSPQQGWSFGFGSESFRLGAS